MPLVCIYNGAGKKVGHGISKVISKRTAFRLLLNTVPCLLSTADRRGSFMFKTKIKMNIIR